MVESVFLLGLQNTSDDFSNQSLEDFMKSWLGQEELPPMIYMKTGRKFQPAQGHTGEKAKN